MKTIKVYTSYFGKIRSLNITNDMVLVSVSNTSPDWFPYELVKLGVKVSPHWDLINKYKSKEISYEVFSERYLEQLGKYVSPERLYRELVEIAEEYNAGTVVLLCWEKDLDTCHRKALSKFLSALTSIEEL